ncbi:MAG: hypothetical protein WKF75_21455, partial [Singulisphaera sp.]
MFLLDADAETPRPWMLVGNAPSQASESRRIERGDDSLVVIGTGDAIRATAEVRLAAPGDTAELWTITLENLADSARRLEVVPYLEWVLNRPDADRGHTQYNRLFAEVEYVAGLHAVLAWDKHSKAMGVLAADIAPEGFLSARVDFLGRARSLATPRALETLDFFEARDTDAHPTFDPIGSLLLGVTLPARGTARVRLLIGLARTSAGDRPDRAASRHPRRRDLRRPEAEGAHPIRHGEIPPAPPEPYVELSDDGRKMLVRTPFTPRPFDHTMSNALGHVVSVTNRGLHTTSSVNAQQNRLTPDWSDTVTREVPSEAIYLLDLDAHEWFSPTYHPLNDESASHEAEFGVDGTAVFRMTKGTLETELTVFVPPDEPAGVYHLVARNRARPRTGSGRPVLPDGAGRAAGVLGPAANPPRRVSALWFENPRNTYRTGPAFVTMTGGAPRSSRRRGRFFGGPRPRHPHLVEWRRAPPRPRPTTGRSPPCSPSLDLPAGEERSVVVVMGQADDRAGPRPPPQAPRPRGRAVALDETRGWWLSLMDPVSVQTDSPEFDRYLDWLKYQALAERIWARRGFYQASGAFGFRDQLQDSVNLIWMDPTLARRQILLHAAQQFLEGDVVHWFHRLQDGRTGFVGRTHASDNLLWL